MSVCCKYCGGLLHEERRGPHIGLYCDDCGRWNTWVKQTHDTGELASEAQQKYAMNLMKSAVEGRRHLTAQQAGEIIRALKE